MTLHEAWVEAQTYIYRMGCFSCAVRFHGWTCLSWQAFGRGQAAAVQEISDITGTNVQDYINACPELDWYIQTDGSHIGFPGWKHDFNIPVHLIPTSESFLNSIPMSRYGQPTVVVTYKQVQDFARLQDVAYNRVYAFPLGIGASFFIDPRSICSEGIYGVILYDDTIPIRAGYVIVIDNEYAFGVGGAVNPTYAGQHLGETLWPSIGSFVRNVYGLDYVHHVTMPCAQPIMNRFNFEQVAIWRRWKRVIA